MKFSIIGCGRVGSAIAFVSVVKRLADQIVLVDRSDDLARGDAADLVHASAFTGGLLDIRAGTLADTAESDVVIVTASVPMNGIRSRLDVAAANVAIFRDLIPELCRRSPHALLVIVSNPVDVMTYVALRLSGLAPQRVFGTGTLIDTGRFRALLAEDLDMNTLDLRAYIIGEHGDSQFPALSNASAGGAPLEHDPDRVRALFEKARLGGYEVVRHKGYTNYAIALAAAMLLESIVNNSRAVMPLSVYVENFAGVRDVCLSLPVVVGRGGVNRVLPIRLDETETRLFQESARVLKEVLSRVWP